MEMQVLERMSSSFLIEVMQLQAKCNGSPMSQIQSESPLGTSLDTLLGSLEVLFQTGDYSDFVFILPNNGVWATHKNILAVRSPYFSNLFQEQQNIQQLPLNIQRGLRSLLHYIYTDVLEFSELQEESPENIDTIIDIASTAQTFQLDTSRFWISLVGSISKLMTPENVVGILRIAGDFKVKEVEEMAMNYITNNLPRIVNQPTIRSMPASILLGLLKTSVDEHKKLKELQRETIVHHV